MSIYFSTGQASRSSLALNDYECDRETALLIAQLQLEDVLQISQGRKGKAPETAAPTDEEIAFKIQAEEFESWKVFVDDVALAQSLDDALQSDAEIIAAHCLLEEAAAADRMAALRLSRGEATPIQTEAQKKSEDPSFNLERISER